MFIRRTRTRSSNEDYVTFRLVRSERTGAKVQQRTLLNLGRHFDVAPPDWPRLCQRIEDLLAGQLPLSPVAPPTLETHAQRIAAQLLARARVGSASRTRGTPDVQSIEVNSLTLLRPRSVGVEQVALWALDQLGLRDLLKTLGARPLPARRRRRLHRRPPGPTWFRALPPGAGSSTVAPWASCWA